MKKQFATFLLAISALSVSANTLFDQLCQFNFNWKKYALQAPAGEARVFHSDKEYIQTHLTNVLKILRSNPTEQLSKEQYHSRMHLIELLDGYRIAGNFPVNYYRHERIPVFIDEHNTHCAVGYLMMKTGHEEMAQRIAANDNYVWVKDLNDPGVPEWQEQSGFTIEELKLIQGAYEFYLEDALFRANRYETPQMPACTTAYFAVEINKLPKLQPEKNIWFKGEGKNGVLNGRWIQNQKDGKPWIVGFYTNGKRSGDWEEYYQGTANLCRTEHWEENKLEGIRKRFDRSGALIEEILFMDGNAISKVNYEYSGFDSVAYVRTILDSAHVFTQVYNSAGALIACGHETVYNPGNLLWFQSIELTALNSVSIAARSVAQSQGNGNELDLNSNSSFGGVNLNWAPPLVEYKKQGDWMYYQDIPATYAIRSNAVSAQLLNLVNQYQHYGFELYHSLSWFPNLVSETGYDSIRVVYLNNNILNFYGYSKENYAHFHIDYYQEEFNPIRYLSRYPHRYAIKPEELMQIKEIGQYNSAGQRTGEWKYFDKLGTMYKTENYLIPQNEEEQASR